MAHIAHMLHDSAYLMQKLKNPIITLLCSPGSVITVENNQPGSDTN
jgi:hypothetical protein